jgi:hypothetical protein
MAEEVQHSKEEIEALVQREKHFKKALELFEKWEKEKRSLIKKLNLEIEETELKEQTFSILINEYQENFSKISNFILNSIYLDRDFMNSMRSQQVNQN